MPDRTDRLSPAIRKPEAAYLHWPVRVSFISVVVKNDGLCRASPGGLEGFDQDYPNARRNGALRAVVCMSGGDMESLLERFQSFGLTTGEDIAVADMMHGEMLPCAGIEFLDASADFPPQCVARAFQ